MRSTKIDSVFPYTKPLNQVEPWAIAKLRAAWIVVLVSVLSVGCKSGSTGERFRLLKNFSSQTEPSKSEGLIAFAPQTNRGLSAPDLSPSGAKDISDVADEAPRYSLAAYHQVSSSGASEHDGSLGAGNHSQAEPIVAKEIEPLHVEAILASRRLREASSVHLGSLDIGNQSSTKPSDDDKQEDSKKQGSKQGTEKQNSTTKEKSAKVGGQTALPSFDSTTATGESTDASFDLNLESLESLALASNPSLSEQQAIVESLRGRWIQAGLGPNPSLGFSGQQIFSNGQAEQIGLYAGHKFVRTEKLSASQLVVCREVEVALQKLAAQQQRVLTDVRLRFYEVLLAQRRTKVTAELVTIAQESLAKTNSLYEAELGTKIDVLRSTVELQEAKLQLETSRNQLTSAWKQLAAVVGQPDLPLQTLRGDIQPKLELDAEMLAQQLLQESPEIFAAVAEQQRAHAQLHRELVEPLPDVDVQSIVQHDNATRAANAALQVSVPIPFCNRNQGAIAEARAKLVAAQYAQQKTELGLKERLAVAWQRYQSALAQVKGFSADDGILNNSRKTLELIRTAYDAGEIGSLDLITAQRVYSQTSLQYVNALSDYWAAKVELEGRLLKDSLQAQ